MSSQAEFGLDAELADHGREGDLAGGLVDYQAHGSLGRMGAQIDDAAGEARVFHGRHGDQQHAGKVPLFLGLSHGTNIRPAVRRNKGSGPWRVANLATQEAERAASSMPSWPVLELQ